MQSLGFIETFMDILIACASVIIIFLISSILLMMRKIDKRVIKAKLFINDNLLEKTWLYISIAGGSFAFNALIMFVKFMGYEEFFNIFYISEITKIIFFVAFILAIWKWYTFIGSFEISKAT